MRTHDLSRVGNAVLLRELEAAVQVERVATSTVLALIGEVDARKLYRPAGFPSMYAYCIRKLRLSESAAWKRIQAARAARRFPSLFAAVAEGRIHLAGVCLLAPRLTEGNAESLIAAASHRTKVEIEQVLARRFPTTEWMAIVQVIPAAPAACRPNDDAVAGVGMHANSEPAPGQVDVENRARLPAPGQVDVENGARLPASGQVDVENGAQQLVPGQVDAGGPSHPASGAHPAQPHHPGHSALPRPMLKPIASDRFAVQFMMGKDMHDDLEYAQALLSDALPACDLVAVFGRALRVLIVYTEKRKFAATTQPRLSAGRESLDPRHVPAHVKRAVWERDGGACTFVGADGQRCGARSHLQFDHVVPVARGGQATVEGIRLRCRAHNQLEAERLFGATFMNEKREATRRESA